MLVYLDSNVVSDVESRTAGVTDDDVRTLEDHVGSGRILVPASPIVAGELFVAPATSSPGPVALGRRYLSLASLNHIPKPHRLLVRAAIQAYASRSGPPAPFERRSAQVVENWRRLVLAAEGEARESVVETSRQQVDEFRALMDPAYPAARKVFRDHKRQKGATPTVADLWPGLAPYYLQPFVRRAGCLRAVKQRGLGGLLQVKPVRALIGFIIGLIHGHTVDGRKPNDGDLRDMFHVTTAAAVADYFVTHDGPLTRLLEKVPDLPMKVVTLKALLTLVPPHK